VLKTLARFGPLLFQGLRRPDAIMLGGGTLLNSRYFFRVFQTHHRPGMPIVIFGSGLQDQEVWGDNLEHEVPVYRDAIYWGVRDPHASQALAERGIRAEVIGDPALSLCRPMPRSDRPRPQVAVNLGCDRKRMRGQQADVNAAAADLLRRLRAEDCDVELVAMHDHDAEDLEWILAQPGLADLPVWSDYDDWSAFVGKVSSFDLVIGQRLHAVIVATGHAIPTISLAYRPKCDYYMESVGMEHYVMLTDQIDVDTLVAWSRELLRDSEAVRRTLTERTDAHREKLHTAARQVLARLRGRDG
jgi:polysaccharide pyruvyl transferase WcaK-like protein